MKPYYVLPLFGPALCAPTAPVELHPIAQAFYSISTLLDVFTLENTNFFASGLSYEEYDVHSTLLVADLNSALEFQSGINLIHNTSTTYVNVSLVAPAFITFRVAVEDEIEMYGEWYEAIMKADWGTYTHMGPEWQRNTTLELFAEVYHKTIGNWELDEDRFAVLEAFDKGIHVFPAPDPACFVPGACREELLRSRLSQQSM